MAAKNARKKKAAPNIQPKPPIASNALGSVMNNNAGPALSERPDPNTIGKIAKPAISATNESMIATIAADFGSETSLGM